MLAHTGIARTQETWSFFLSWNNSVRMNSKNLRKHPKSKSFLWRVVEYVRFERDAGWQIMIITLTLDNLWLSVCLCLSFRAVSHKMPLAESVGFQPATHGPQVYVEVFLGCQVWKSGVAKVSSYSRHVEWLDGNVKDARTARVTTATWHCPPPQKRILVNS